MTYKENIKAILECYFTGVKEEIIDSACNRILEQEPKFIAKSDGTIEQIKDCNDCVIRKEWEKIGKLISVILEKQTEQEPCVDVIDKIRAEIEQEPYVSKMEVLDIIDKYTAESEGV